MLLALSLSVAMLGIAATVGWALYDRFASDVAAANGRVPESVTRALGPAEGSRASTVLLAAPGGDVRSVVLMRSDQSNHRNGVLLLTDQVPLGGSPVGRLARDGDVPALAAALRAEGIPVDHVILIPPDRLGAVVDDLGGVTISNSKTATLALGDVQMVFEQGQLAIDGAAAESYAFGTAKPEQSASRSTRQARVLAAIGSGLLLPSSAGGARRVGTALQGSVATDLSAGALAAWAAERFESPTTTRCVVTGTQLERTVVERFLHGTGETGRKIPCADHVLASPIPSPFAELAGASWRNIEALVRWTTVLAWMTLAIAGLVLLLRSGNASRYLRNARRRAGSIDGRRVRHATTALAEAARRRVPDWTPRERAETVRTASRTSALAHRAAGAGGAISHGVASARGGIASRLEARRARAAQRERIARQQKKRPAPDHGIAEGLADRLEELRERRGSKRRADRPVRGHTFAVHHLGRIEVGSPPPVAYIAAGLMVIAGIAAVVALFLV